MKVKFTKLAALLLAGVALLAAGCTDYEVDIQKVDKKVDELAAKTAADLDAQVNALKAMISAVEQNYKDADAALKQQLEAQIADLQNLKLDKSTFDEYKAETAQTLKLLNDALKEIQDNYATKKELEDAMAEISAKLDDYVLKSTFEETLKLYAQKKDLEEVKAKLEKDIADAKDEMAEKLNKALEEVNGKIEALDERITILENAVADIIDELAFAEGDLQGYIDDADAATLEAAMDYTDEWIEAVAEYLDELMMDVWGYITILQERFQSIVFVPDYDDLKITVNMAYLGQGDEVAVLDQPFKVQYKFLPAQYAWWAAAHFDEVLEYDVKPVNTRAEEEEEENAPALQILSAEYDDDVDETGIVTFTVLPVNIASAQFAANGLKPNYEIGLWAGGYVTGWDLDGKKYGYFSMDERDVIEENGGQVLTFGVWTAKDIDAYKARTAFAASMRLKDADGGSGTYHYYYGEWVDDLVPEYNEVASTYNVLYPDATKIEILPDPYKELEDGSVRLFTEDETHQRLPYNSDETRIILDGAVAAVSIDGGEPMSIAAANAAGYVIPDVKISETAKIDYIQGGENEPLEKDFTVNANTYATVNMNLDEPASDRKLEIGNLVAGTYTFTSILGDFTASGDVLITKELGEVSVSANAVWTWEYAEGKGDALVDHNLFYETGEEPTIYTRVEWPVTVDEAEAAALEEQLGITLEDFAGLEPMEGSYKVQVADVPAEGAEPAFADLAEDAAFKIENVAIKDGKLYADFVGFDWNKIYQIVADYDLPYAQITVNGTFTTKDRNREMVALDKYEYTFDINKLDEETGFGWLADKKVYYWESEPMHKAIFKAFDENGVINVEGNEEGDFEYDADLEAFSEGELNGWILRLDPAEPAYKYVRIKKADIYAFTTDNMTAQALKDMNTGVQDPNDPYTYLGEVLVRHFTTFIGEQVEVRFQFNYRVPAYDFLHQANYTFDDGKWYTMASPKYDINKNSLKKYDVNYMNIPALSFNVIDENKRFFDYNDPEVDPADPTYFYDENLYINFFYTGPDPVDDTALEAQSATDELTTYGNLWFTPETAPEGAVTATAKNFEHTVFYYRSIRDAIPMYGTLQVECDGVRFDIPTSFEEGNGGKYIAGKDYSNFELRAWKPFYVPTYEQTLYIDLDEHGDYSANVLEGLQFFDARQVAASSATDTVKDPFVEGTYSIDGFNYGTKAYFRPMLGFNEVQGEKTWGWVVGNADDKGKSVDGKKANGFYNGVTSWEAYDLHTKSFEFDDRSGVPADLKGMLSVDQENYVVNVDYNSETEFKGTAEIDFSFIFQTPWQKFDQPFSVRVVVRGLDQQ